MKVRVIYDPILRQTTASVTVFDAELKKQADEMLLTMQRSLGLGLAANQVGLDKRLIVLGYHRADEKDEVPEIPFQQLCNPKVVKFSKEKETMDEGCLSLPGLELPVERSAGVVVEAQDVTGKPVTIKAKGLHARVLQHEIDHLNGVLFTDRVKNLGSAKDYHFARIVFLGSDNFSAVVFNALVEAGYNVIAALMETAKPGGRGQELIEPVMKTVATEQAVAVFQPEDRADLTHIIQQLQPDLLVLASYGKILPAEALALPTYGALNVHPSLLPQFRGATPIQSALLAGVAETGVSLITMDPKVDTGALIDQVPFPLTGRETAEQLKGELALIGARLVIKNLPTYLAGQAQIKPQVGEVTLTKKLTKEMGEIDWSQSALQIDRKIRALNPWPGTYTWLGDKRLKILAAQLHNDQLSLITVQLEGKKPTNWADFARGYYNQLTKASWFSKIY